MLWVLSLDYVTATNVQVTVKLNYFVSKLVCRPDSMSRDDRMRTASNSLRQRLMHLNDATANAIRGHIECAVNNFIANGRWRFIDGNGPKIERVAEKEPIMWKYVN